MTSSREEEMTEEELDDYEAYARKFPRDEFETDFLLSIIALARKGLKAERDTVRHEVEIKCFRDANNGLKDGYDAFREALGQIEEWGAATFNTSLFPCKVASDALNPPPSDADGKRPPEGWLQEVLADAKAEVEGWQDWKKGQLRYEVSPTPPATEQEARVRRAVELGELLIGPPPATKGERPCTCHPDDNPPDPCAKKYAYSECVLDNTPPATEDADLVARLWALAKSFEVIDETDFTVTYADGAILVEAAQEIELLRGKLYALDVASPEVSASEPTLAERKSEPSGPTLKNGLEPLDTEGERDHNIDNTGDCLPECWCHEEGAGDDLMRWSHESLRELVKRLRIPGLNTGLRAEAAAALEQMVLRLGQTQANYANEVDNRNATIAALREWTDELYRDLQSAQDTIAALRDDTKWLKACHEAAENQVTALRDALEKIANLDLAHDAWEIARAALSNTARSE